jgi:hypothetical protein
VLELELEQPDGLHGLAGRTGDRDRGEVVCGEDLLHLRVRDRVSGRGSTVTGHHDAVREPQTEDGRALGDLQRPAHLERRRERLGMLASKELDEAGVGTERGSRQRELDPIGHSPPFCT